MFAFFRARRQTEFLNKTRELPRPAAAGLTIPLGDGSSTARLRFGNAQHIGSRGEQQDSFGYSDLGSPSAAADKGVLAVLADGMGGLADGRQISEYIVGAMLAMFQGLEPSQDIPGQLARMAEGINGKVCETYNADGESRAGSTLAALLLLKTRLYWVCAGDSRAYVYRKNALYQLNEDHTYLNQLFTEHLHGGCSLRDAKSDARRSALTSYIGHASLPQLDYNRRGFAIQRGDVFLLCSDGVYNALNNAEIIEHLHDEPQHAAQKILRAVLGKRMQGQDNATVMVIEYQ